MHASFSRNAACKMHSDETPLERRFCCCNRHHTKQTLCKNAAAAAPTRSPSTQSLRRIIQLFLLDSNVFASVSIRHPRAHYQQRWLHHLKREMRFGGGGNLCGLRKILKPVYLICLVLRGVNQIFVFFPTVRNNKRPDSRPSLRQIKVKGSNPFDCILA